MYIFAKQKTKLKFHTIPVFVFFLSIGVLKNRISFHNIRTKRV